MPGLEDLYREIILDHYRTPRNRGELERRRRSSADGHNPLCGDEITVYLDVDRRHRRRRDRARHQDRRPGLLDLAVVGVDDEPGDASASRSATSRALVRRFKTLMGIDGIEAEAGRRRHRHSATSRRCRASSSSRCASSAPCSAGTRCCKRSTRTDRPRVASPLPDDIAEARARAGRGDPRARSCARRSPRRRRHDRRTHRRAATSYYDIRRRRRAQPGDRAPHRRLGAGARRRRGDVLVRRTAGLRAVVAVRAGCTRRARRRRGGRP